jgi:hypothetical protein
LIVFIFFLCSYFFSLSNYATRFHVLNKKDRMDTTTSHLDFINYYYWCRRVSVSVLSSVRIYVIASSQIHVWFLLCIWNTFTYIQCIWIISSVDRIFYLAGGKDLLTLTRMMSSYSIMTKHDSIIYINSYNIYSLY